MADGPALAQGGARKGLDPVDVAGEGGRHAGGGAHSTRLLDDAVQESLVLLASDDPANVYGAALPWPEREGARPQRAAGARVVLHDGRLVGYVGKTGHSVLTFLPEDDELARARAADALARGLAHATGTGSKARAVLIERIDGEDPTGSRLAPHLREAGFSPTSRGFHRRAEPEERA